MMLYVSPLSVKQALGLGGDDPIQEAISDVITASIETIQSIINQLPADLAAELNDALLNTAVDIESKVKGDRLLEFDENAHFGELGYEAEVVGLEKVRKNIVTQQVTDEYSLAA